MYLMFITVVMCFLTVCFLDSSTFVLQDCNNSEACKTKINVIPRFARSLVVSFPMPVFAPVIMTVLPSSRILDDHRPQKNSLCNNKMSFTKEICNI